MFIGHYSAAFALRRYTGKRSLAALFVAVQLIDYAWAVFILTGVEKARVVPHFLAASPLDLYYLPWTHGLLTSLAWAIVSGVLYGWAKRGDLGAGAKAAGVAFAAAVFSHWLLDLVAHRPDLPLIGNSYKVGFGLWRNLPASIIVESAFVIAGAVVYLRRIERPERPTIRVIVLLLVMFALWLPSFLRSAPPNIKAVAFGGLFAYSLFAIGAHFVDVRVGAA